jgi:hypothetical protein
MHGVEASHWTKRMPAHCLMLAFAMVPLASAAQDNKQAAPPPAAARMNEAGPDQMELARQAGVWDVVATFWPAPGTSPMVTRGLIAERNMIGPFLQEIMRPAPDSSAADFRRIDYLTYDRVEGRWKYVSMDTRLPVSIMPAWSFRGEQNGTITLQFEPLAFVGFGPDVEGRLMRSDLEITMQGADHGLKRQHFILSDGTGREWLAAQYEYTRHK